MTETFAELVHDAKLLCATGGLEPMGLRCHCMSGERSMDAPSILPAGSVSTNWVDMVAQTTISRDLVL
jgi:hypothetical protein